METGLKVLLCSVRQHLEASEQTGAYKELLTESLKCFSLQALTQALMYYSHTYTDSFWGSVFC